MSVAPDLLLKAAPEVKPKTPAAKAPARTAESSQNEASSFAQVYAKERQAKPVERSDAPAKSPRDKPSEADGEEQPSAAAADGQPVLADSGNPLPSEPGELDPLLLMAMAGQLPAEGEPGVDLEAVAEGEAELGVDAGLALPATASVNSAAPATLTEASSDPTLEMLNSLPGVRLALGQNQAQGPQEHPAADNAAPPTPNAAQNFAGVQAAFAERKLAGAGNELAEGEPGEAELPLGELTAAGLDGLQESPAEARADNFASKLSALSQAIAPQGSATQRAALIPGQPVPMQQGGWSEAVVDRVMWLSSQNLKSAEIQLDPAELGRLEVRVHMTQDQTQVTFASPNANVRDALEGQMHRLRELFAQQGMNQLDVNVSDQSLARGWQGQGGDGQNRGGSASGRHGKAEDDLPLGSVGELRTSSLSSGRGLVDYYA